MHTYLEQQKRTVKHSLLSYTRQTAKRLMLQMPLVVITAGDVKSGVSVVYLLEHVNYVKVQQFIN